MWNPYRAIRVDRNLFIDSVYGSYFFIADNFRYDGHLMSLRGMGLSWPVMWITMKFLDLINLKELELNINTKSRNIGAFIWPSHGVKLRQSTLGEKCGYDWLACFVSRKIEIDDINVSTEIEEKLRSPDENLLIDLWNGLDKNLYASIVRDTCLNGFYNIPEYVQKFEDRYKKGLQ
jgi:hypothetical protein